MVQTFKGRTEDAEAPFLSAGFWREGKSVTGKLVKAFTVKAVNGGEPQPCFVLELDDPVEVDGEEQERVSIGNMAGIKMALQGCKPPLTGLRIGDVIRLECTGVKPAKKEGFSPRVNFELEVVRN